MKYITKELYRASQIGRYHPEPLPEAAEFSEELFERLFEERLNSRLADREEEREWALERGKDAPPVDVAAERKDMEDGINSLIQDMLLEIPEEILAKVADKRVLALDAATPEVVEMISKRNRDICEEWQRRSGEYKMTSQRRRPKAFMKKFHFHDRSICGVQWRGKNLEVCFDSDCFGASMKKVIFVNCEVLKMDEGFADSQWKYDEIYDADGGSEIHVLSANWPKSELYDLIVRASYVRYEYNK